MRQLSPSHMLESQWVRALTWLLKALASTLVKGDLMGIAKAIHLSRAIMRNIRQNLFFAFIYNALASQSRQACSTRSSACSSVRSSPALR